MKNVVIICSLLFLAACTPDIALKNAALRHVIIQFDDQLKALPDQESAKNIKAQTKIDVVSLERTSDTQAVVLIKMDTVPSDNPSGHESRDIKVHLEKTKEWSVTTE